jgi:hypothetical protein
MAPSMLLLVALVLLIVAVAGGIWIHPVVFALGVVALAVFFTGWPGRTV